MMMMKHVTPVFNRLGTQMINYTIYQGIQKRTPDVNFDVIKMNDPRNITCLLNVNKHFFINTL